MKIFQKFLVIFALMPLLSYVHDISSSSSLLAFERGGRGHSEGYNSGGFNNRSYENRNQSQYNQERNAYSAGKNQGYKQGYNQQEGSGGGSSYYVQPNTSLPQLEEYANPNSAANQNLQYNQQQQQQDQYQY